MASTISPPVVRLTFVLAGQNPTATWRPPTRRRHREVWKWRSSSSAPVLPQSRYETVGAGNGLPQPQPNRRNGLPRRFIPKQPTCRYEERIQMSFTFNRFIFWCPSRHTLGCANLYSLISHRQCLTECNPISGMACTPSQTNREYRHRWVATSVAGQPLRRVQKNTLCPESFRGRGVKRTGPRLELIDEVGHSHDVVDFGRGRRRGRAAERRTAVASVVPTQFEAAQHILPEVILDRASPREDVA